MTALTSRWRVGIIGGGFMAQMHSRAARAAGARLVGLASSNLERAEEACRELGVERAFADAQELIDHPDIDVVHVCTPNNTHVDYTAATLAAGKHVICEKPLATTAAEAEHLAELAIRADVTATVPFVYRFHPNVREARARVLGGSIGRLLTIQGTYLQDWLLPATADNWRVDAALGGRSRAFADIGSHWVDMIEFVTGDRLHRLAATAQTFFPERSITGRVATEDAVAIVFELSGGAMGTLLVSQLAAGRKNRLFFEISGSKEALAYDNENPEVLWLGRMAGYEIVIRDPLTMAPDAARLCRVPVGHIQGYQDAFNGFVADSYAAMAGQHPEGLPRFADGVRAARITDAVMDSAAGGGWVDIPD